jgi:hypothetical protein
LLPIVCMDCAIQPSKVITTLVAVDVPFGQLINF